MSAKTEDATLTAWAKIDADRYTKALADPFGHTTCARIEQDWALYGYPPEIVSTVLSAVASGQDFASAEDAALSGKASA